MATKSKSKNRRKRGKLGEVETTEVPQPGSTVVVTGGGAVSRRTSLANGLFKVEADDSILKHVVVYGAAAFGAYYGIKLLSGVIGKDLKTNKETNTRAAIEQRADSGQDAVSILAKLLAVSINPEWKIDQPKVPPGYFTDANEVEVFRILAGPTTKGVFGQLVVKEFAPVVNSKQSWLGVSAAYLALTGRPLDYDLRNNLGSWDYQQVQPYLAKIMCRERRVDAKTKKVSFVKTC